MNCISFWKVWNLGKDTDDLVPRNDMEYSLSGFKEIYDT